ncbi:hypothetical protein EMIT0P228_150095 [Pseudomonas brassicacearum]
MRKFPKLCGREMSENSPQLLPPPTFFIPLNPLRDLHNPGVRQTQSFVTIGLMVYSSRHGCR